MCLGVVRCAEVQQAARLRRASACGSKEGGFVIYFRGVSAGDRLHAPATDYEPVGLGWLTFRVTARLAAFVRSAFEGTAALRRGGLDGAGWSFIEAAGSPQGGPIQDCALQVMLAGAFLSNGAVV